MKTKYSTKKDLPVKTLMNTLTAILMLFALGTRAQTYCNPSMIGSPQYEYISNVTFAGINHTSGPGSSTPVNYTTITGTVVPGSAYGFSMTGATPNTNYPEWYKVWIDWNQNGILNDAGEYYDLGYSGILPWVATTVITVPLTAVQGTTRMRVMMAGNSTGNTTNYAGSNPCYSSVGYGEVDDFSIYVKWSACSGINTPTLSVPGSTTLCQGLPANVNVSGATPSLGVTYQWQQSSAAAGPFTTAVAPSSSVLSVQIPTIANGTTYYVLVATCSSTAASASATSNIISLTGAPAPVVSTISASPAVSCVGTSVTLNAQSSPGATYNWIGPNGFSSTLQIPGIANAPASASGNYSVTASQYNCSSTVAVVSITVSPNPTVTIQASQPYFCLGGAPVTLTANTNGTTYVWSTVANTQTVSVSPSVTTVYDVLVQNSFNCSSQVFYTVSVIDASLSVLGAWSCNNGPGGSGILTAQAFTPSIVYWYASATSTTPLTSASASSLGIATFSINNSYGDSTVYVQAKYSVCASAMIPVTLTVSPQPTVTIVSSPTLNTSAPTITVCSGDTYTFTALGAANYTWNNGQTTAPTNTFLVIPSTYTFFSNTNNFTISAVSSDGCTGGKKISLYVNPSPVVSAATFTSNICPGGSTTLYAIGNASSYMWSANANNSNAPTIVVSPTQSAVYTVIGTAANGCTATASQSVTLYTPATITITSQRPKMCVGESINLTASGAVTYTWVSNNFNLQGPIAFVNPGQTTSYQVTGTDVHGCVNTTTMSLVVEACTGIQQVSGNSGQIKVYPNPNNGEFTVELNNGLEKTMDLIDIAGRLVMTSTSGDDAVRINISLLADGVYYLRVRSNNAMEVIKVVKQ